MPDFVLKYNHQHPHWKKKEKNQSRESAFLLTMCKLAANLHRQSEKISQIFKHFLQQQKRACKGTNLPSSMPLCPTALVKVTDLCYIDQMKM